MIGRGVRRKDKQAKKKKKDPNAKPPARRVPQAYKCRKQDKEKTLATLSFRCTVTANTTHTS